MDYLHYLIENSQDIHISMFECGNAAGKSFKGSLNHFRSILFFKSFDLLTSQNLLSLHTFKKLSNM